MKKGLIFLAALLLLGGAAAVYAVDLVNAGKGQVEITEQVIWGDPSAAEGITLEMHTQWKRKLLWDTVYPIGRPEQISTEFTLVPKGIKVDSWRTEELSLYCLAGFGISGNFENLDNFELQFKEIFKDVASRTPDGGEVTEIVNMKDYCDYYPLEMEIVSDKLPTQIWSGGDEAAIRQILTDTFRIPVYEGQKLEITVGKNESGQIVNMSCNSLGGSVEMDVAGVIRSEGCYMAVTAWYYGNDQDMVVPLDTEEGRGIWFLPFEQAEEGTQICFDRLERLTELPEDSRVQELVEDEQGNLVLLTVERGQLVLTVLETQVLPETQSLPEKQSLAERQRQILFQTESTVYDVKVGCGGYLINMSDSGFCFITPDAEGQYQVRVTGNHAVLEQYMTEEQYYNSRELQKSLSWKCDFYWDGERLAIAGYGTERECSVYLTVYGAEGLRYAGLYKHSGDLDSQMEWTGAYTQPYEPDGSGLLNDVLKRE